MVANEKREKIVCMGDSLTEGYEIQPGTSWPSLLNNIPELEVINSGISGDTTAGMLARFYPMVISHEPDYVIIMGGTNDLWFGIGEEQVISNILSMTKVARHHNIISLIGLPTLFYPGLATTFNEFFIQASSFNAILVSFRNKLQEVAESKELPVIDFSAGMSKEMFLEDGLHPNEKGHHQMMSNARNLLATLI